MNQHIVLVSPDRGDVYDGSTPDARGVGGGITARIALLTALARLGQRVEAYVNCAARTTIDDVDYIPLAELQSINCDILIACSTGGDLSFASLAKVSINAKLRLLWSMGSPRPEAIDVIQPNYFVVASNFLRDVAVKRWNISEDKIFVVHHGLHQLRFASVEAHPPARDPYALVYTGHPSKGLDAAIQVLRRLRAHDEHYHLDVYGGNALWGRDNQTQIDEPGVRFMGLTGQRDLIPRLFEYGFCLALQAMEEGFSIAVQEAKRAGIIVLACAGSSFPEAIQNGIDGYLLYTPHEAPETHDRAAAVIRQLNADEPTAARIRRAALRTPWDWDIAARTWIAFNGHCLGINPAPIETIDGVPLARFPDGLHNLAAGHYYPLMMDTATRIAQTASFTSDLPILTRRKNVLIAGYYGFGNLGDEAILTAMLDGLNADHICCVVSGNPRATQEQHGVDAVRWDNIGALVDAVERADAIILGGGGLFQDYWGVPMETLLMPTHRGMAFFGTFPLLAALLDKPLYIHAMGVGPLTTDDGRMLARLAFARAVHTSVRESESLALVASLGVDMTRIEKTADAAFALRPAPAERAADLMRSIRLMDKTTFRLGVALRPWDVNVDPIVWTAAVAAALDRLLDEVDAEIIFIPFQAYQESEGVLTDDARIAQIVLDQMRQSARARLIAIAPTPHAMIDILGTCDLILGMRLHAILLASIVGVPSVGLIYDPKVANALTDLGLGEFAHDVTTLDAASLAQSLRTATDRRDELRQLVSAHAEIAAQTARRDLQALSAQIAESASIAESDTDENRLLKTALRRYLVRSDDLLLDEHAEIQRAIALLVERDREVLTLVHHALASLTNTEIVPTRAPDAEVEIRALTAQANALKTQIDGTQMQMSALYVQKDTLMAHIDRIESDYSQLANDISALKNENTAITAQLITQQADLAVTARHLSESNAYIAHLRRDIAANPVMGALSFIQVLLRNPIRAAKMSVRTLYHLVIPLQARLLFRSLRQHSPDMRAFMHNPPTYLARKTYHIAVPLRVRLALKRTRTERQMNWYAFAFERYKRARMALYGSALDGIRAPGEPGLVTVVLPAYNGADMIAEAIDTVLNQTYPHFELIIINDGSKDETGAIADAYAQRDARIRVVHQENRKIPRTLSRGFQMARGEFLTWTSCDNRMKPDFLQQMVESLQRHPSWDMIYANMDIIADDGSYLRGSNWYRGYQRPAGSEHVYLPDAPDELNVWANNYIGAAFMYRSRIAYLIGDYSRHRFTTEDYDYWMRINAIGILRHADFDAPIYDYRFHEQSLTAKDKELGITRSRERLMVFEDFRRDFLLSPLIWLVDGDDIGLQARIAAAGHFVKSNEYPLDQVPPVWTPLIYVRVVVDATTPIEPPDLPAWIVRALVVSGASTLPASISTAWDCAIVIGDFQTPLPMLDKPHQGWMAAKDTAALFHLLDIRAKSHHLAQIETLIEQPPPSTRRATIIICTHRFNQRLVNAIRSVARQTIPAADYEVIVVNNNPAHNQLAASLAQIRAQDYDSDADRLRLVVCPIPGLSAARNVGIAAARGEIICFIDDDAIAEPNWLEHILSAYDQNPDAGVVGGYIVLSVPRRRPKALAPGLEKYWSHFVGAHAVYMRANAWYEYPWGANWTARRDALLRAGGFRTRYGRKGDDFGGGEEIAAAAMIARLGYSVGVQPTARVRHDVDPERFTIKHLRRTLLAGHLSQYGLQRDLVIPMESGIRATFYMLRHVNFDPSLSRRTPIAWLDMLMRKRAQVALLRAQLRDLRARFRRPRRRESFSDDRS